MCAIFGAQAQTIVKGVLQDSLTHEPEEYATVRVFHQTDKSQSVATAIADESGAFRTTVTGNGSYTLVCSMMGQGAVERSFSIEGRDAVDLGVIYMSENSALLSDVLVVAQKPVVRMEADKMTYSVEDDVDSRSLTVLDMLRKVPMVSVDGQDNITVNGSSAFKVYVDDKPNVMMSSNPSQIFKAIPASMVRQIEVVTNPGAKYDAEGAGGILILRMANMADGGGQTTESNMYNGSVYATGGNRGAGTGASLAGQKKRFTYSSDLNYNYVNNGTVSIDMLRTQTDGSVQQTSTTTRNPMPFAMGNVAMGYEIDKRNALNASFGLTYFDVKNKSVPTTRMYGGVYGTGFSYSNPTRIEMKNMQYNGSFDYQHFFTDDRANSITLTYQISSTPTDMDNTTDFAPDTQLSTDIYDLTSRHSTNHNNTTEHVLQVDAVTKLATHSKLNSGLKYAHRLSTADAIFYQQGQQMDQLSSDYEHRNQIGAIYAESENQWEHVSAKAGLRYEHTWQQMRYFKPNNLSYSTDYGNLVPSLSTSYSFKKAQNLGLTYNIRISRPGITYLNPYIDRSDPTALTYGNSDLDVEKSHNVSLVYNIYRQKIIFNATLRQTIANDGIEQYSFYRDNVLNTTYGNIVDRRQTALSLFASWSVTSNTRLVLNGGGSYSTFRSAQLDESNSGWAANATLSLQQKIAKTWNVSATIIANSRTYTLQGWNSGFNMGVLSVSKSLLKDRLNLSVYGLAGFSKGGKLRIERYSRGADFDYRTNIRVPMTRVAFTARWTFGNTAKQFQKHATNVKSDYIEHKSDSENIGNAGGSM